MARMLTENDIQEMHSLALKMLEVTGVRFDTQESRDLFEKNGARVENGRVYIPAKMVEDALKINGKAVNYDPNAPKSVGASSLGTVPAIYDYDKNVVRKATLDDVTTSYMLQMTSPLYGAARCNVIEPTGNDSKHPHIGQVALALKYLERGNKFGLMRVTAEHCVDKNIYETQKEVISFIRAFYDNEASIGASFCPMSPLAYDEEVLQNIDAAIDSGIPSFCICPCTLANMSGPASVRGVVIHDAAISLAGLVYIKLKHPEVTVTISGASAMSDLRALQPSYGCPESIYMCVMLYEYCDYFGIGSSLLGGMTDAICDSYQAGVETAMTGLLPFYLTDTNYYSCYTGFMGAFYCGNFEKMILDEDTIGYLQRILDGQTVKPGAVLDEEILKGMTTDYYLTRRTPKDYRQDYFLPKHFCKLVGAGRNAEPEKADIMVRAQMEIKRRKEMYEFPVRDEYQKKLLNEYLPTGYKY